MKSVPLNDKVDYEIMVDDYENKYSPEIDDNTIPVETCEDCDGAGYIEQGYDTYVCKTCQGRGFVSK